MKIIHVNDVVYGYASGDPSANGGAERYEWLLARAMAAAGWNVTVGVRRALARGQRATIEGVEFVGIGDGPALRSPITWHRFLMSERPDWWFWQCADHWLGPGFAVAKLAGVKTIFSAMHDRDVDIRRSLFRRPRFWPLYALGLAWSDRIFVQHGEQLSKLPRPWQAKASILPGIVDQTPKPKPHSERDTFVAWVAVLRKPKRPDLLVEIARRMPETRFVVCGGPSSFMSPPGYGEQIIEAFRTQPNIDYLGHVAPDKTRKIIGDAAVLLSTSDEEGFPSVFLEAWSTGTPVVSLNIDPDELIGKKHLGRVSGSIEHAVSDIQTLLNSTNDREQIAIRARRYVEEAHSEAAAVAVIESGIKSCGGKRNETSVPPKNLTASR